MKTLLPPPTGIQKICGIQSYDPAQSYRPTRHHLAVLCADGLRLFHTMTGELLLLEKGETWDSCEEDLIAHRFLVPVAFDEAHYAESIRGLMRLSLPSKATTRFTVFTTTECNARCFYCYEQGRKRMPMSPQTALDTAQYILRASAGKKIKLRWFGGEPLYNMDVIRIICGYLSEHNALFSSTMVTNGLYFTKAVAEEAKEAWHLKWAQITLDGTERVYNQTKNFIDRDTNAFQTVLQNIESALAIGIHISIRLNTDGHNEEDMLQLCDILANRFHAQQGLHVYTSPIRDHQGKKSDAADSAVDQVEKKLFLLGLHHLGNLDNSFKLNRCMADDDASETILPDGRIGKCEHFSETETIGSIYSAERDQGMIRSWKERMADQEECLTCPLYPRCIRLKKCEWEQSGCSKVDRQIKIQQYKQQIASFIPTEEP